MKNLSKSGSEDLFFEESRLSKKHLRILLEFHRVVWLVGEKKLSGSIRQFERIWYNNSPNSARGVFVFLRGKEILIPVDDVNFRVDLDRLEDYIVSLPEFRDFYCFIWKLQKTIVPDLCGNTREFLKERTGFYLNKVDKIGLTK